MGKARKNIGACKDWPDPCLTCGVILCLERNQPPSKVESCVPKVAWIKGHSLAGL